MGIYVIVLMDPIAGIDLSQMIAFGLSFSICYGTSVGLGKHEVDLLPQWRSTLRKCQYAFSVLYVRFSFSAKLLAKSRRIRH